MTTRRITTSKLAAIGVALSLAFAPALAEAKPGNSGSAGSRGSKTHSAPPSTQTAPGAAQPMQRSATPQNQPGAAQQAQRPNAPAPAQGGFFGSALGKGLMAGLIGAGIFGLLSGSGLFSGLGSMASFFGLLLQVGLIALAVMLAVKLFRARRNNQLATAAPQGAGPAPQAPMQREAFGGMFGGGASTGGAAAYGASQVRDLQIGPDDFSAFERKLAEIQSSYGEENLNHLRRLVTEEMASYFAEDLAENARKGVINKLSGAKLLEGDLAESWSEANEEYATVAMRFSVMDTMVDRNTGAYVSGDRQEPSETTELWTFVRPINGAPDDWKLSAIQQTA